MKIIKASINSIPVTLYSPETLQEYKEGARIKNGQLKLDEGFIFDFRLSPTKLIMENSGVDHDLTLLYFYSLKKSGLVIDTGKLKANDSTHVSSTNIFGVVIELRSDFCNSNSIDIGAIVKLNEEL